MRFSAQEEYGLRCLLQIAREPTGSLSIPEIAAREGLTAANVGKLMRVLRQAGLVKSSRGQKGGYQLAIAPEELKVGAALNLLGGRLYSKEFCDCYRGLEAVCVHNLDCSIRSLWALVDAAVERALRNMTLQDLLCGEQDLPHGLLDPVLNRSIGQMARS